MGKNLDGLRSNRGAGLLGHARQLTPIRPDVGHLMGNDEMMLCVHGTLHIVTDDPAAPAARGHRARIGIRKRDLLVLALHHLSVQRVQTLYLLAQRRNLLVAPPDLGFRHRWALAIGAVELSEVAGSALVDL